MLRRLKGPIEGLNKVWLGTISVALATVAVVGIVGIGRLGLGQTVYRGEFAQAAQIRSGDQVTIAGIPVGTVGGAELAGDRVIVKFKVRNDVHLGRDTRAAIKLTTLLGSRYLELTPAGGGDLEDRRIRLPNTSVPYDLQQTLKDATTTFEEVDASRAAASLATLSQGLDGVPEALPQALHNVKSLAAIIFGRRDQIGSLLSSLDTLTSMIRDQKANLGSLVLQGRDLLAEIVSRRAAVQQLFVSTTALVDTTKTIVGDEPSINKMLTNVRDFSRMLAEKDALLRSLLQTLPLPIRNWANASGSSNSIDANFPVGLMIDSWMCAISARAEQFNLPKYLQDCKPAPDPFPGWPPPDPARGPQ